MLKVIAALLALGTSAFAADLPIATKAPAYVPYSSWTGFYFGAHGGYGWGEYSPSIDIGPFFTDPKPEGGVFGAHAGYNWQWTSAIVGGLEIDYDFATVKDSQLAMGALVGTGIALNTKVDSLASIRARAGYLLTPAILLYGTAGFGFAHDVASIVIPGAVGPFGTLTAATNDFGWVAGGGLEYAFTPNLLARVEYLHYGFGEVAHSFQPIGTVNSRLEINVARAGATYKF